MFLGGIKRALITFCGALQNDLKKSRTETPFGCFHNILYILQVSEKKNRPVENPVKK